MVGKERWEEIRRAVRIERLSISVARWFDLDRKTIRRCVRQETWQPYQRAARTETLPTEHATFLAARAPAVQYSARILYQELRQQRGYGGSYDTVKRFVQPLRALRLQAERALVRFETPPGHQSQIDILSSPAIRRRHASLCVTTPGPPRALREPTSIVGSCPVFHDGAQHPRRSAGHTSAISEVVEVVA